MFILHHCFFESCLPVFYTPTDRAVVTLHVLVHQIEEAVGQVEGDLFLGPADFFDVVQPGGALAARTG